MTARRLGHFRTAQTPRIAGVGCVALGFALLFGALLPAHAAEPAPGAVSPRVIRVGVLMDNEPFSERTAEGRLEGFAVDLLAGIERIMALRLDRVVGPTHEINGAFLDGRLDMLQSYARSPEREGHADFSVPYLTMAGSIFVRDGLPEVERVADLRGLRVLVHRESLGERLLRAEGLEDSIVIVGSVEDALRRVAAGEGDATLASRLTGISAIHRLGLKGIKPDGEPIPGYNVDYCFAVRDGDRELLSRINEGLAVLERTGEYDRIYRRWLVPFDRTKYTALDVVIAIAAGLAIALIVVVWALIHQRGLNRRIARQSVALRESDERLRLAVDAAQIGIWSWRVAEGELIWTPRMYEVWGLSPEAPISYERFLESVHPDDRERVIAAVRESHDAGAIYDIEYRIILPDGSVRWIAAFGRTHHDAAGNPVRMTGAVRDITAHKLIEIRDQESRAQLHQVLERVTDGFVALDRDWRYTYVNKRAGEIFGRDPRKLIGKHIWTEFPEGVGQPFHRAYERALAEQQPIVQEEYYPPYDRWFENFIYPSPDGLSIYFHDTTVRKRAEGEIRRLNAGLEQRVLERTAELEAANKELEAFSYSVSHDLRAPLRAVTGFAHILASQHRDHLNDEGRHFLDNIIQSGVRMGRLIDDLLAFSRLGRRALRLASVSLGEVLRDVVSDLGSRIAETGAQIDVPADLPVVAGERTLLHQIFSNLLSNALTYRRAGVAPRISITAATEGGRVSIAVRDNGIGIRAEHLEKIFHVFQRLHSDDDIPGTGIGLAIVKRSVERLGGAVTVNSVPGTGSVFTIELASAHGIGNASAVGRDPHLEPIA